MKKTLLSLFALLVAATGFAQTVNTADITPEVTDDGITWTVGNVTFTAANESGSNKPTQNASAQDIRLYAKNTLTITSADGNLKSLVFTLSKQGLKRLAPITASAGEIATQAAGDTEVTWTGDTQSVVLTVGDQANFGTESTKAGQFDFSAISITLEGGGTVAPTPDPDQPTTLWSETFSSGQGNFTIEDKTLPEATTYIWKYDDRYNYMKASAYVGNVNYAAESWLISPVLDMTEATDPILTFSHAGKYFGTIADEAILMGKAEGGEWTALPIDAYFDGSSWTFVTATIDLKQFEGKKAQFAFVYKSTADAAGTWEVKDLSITGKGQITVEAKEPVVPTYTTIAELKAAATANATNVTFAFTDLLVTGIKGTSLYVTDGTEGMLFYGGSNSQFKAGDKISGEIQGGLVLYSGLTEVQQPDYSAVTVTSSDNAVEPKLLTMADIGTGNGLKTYENMLVKIENVSFASDALVSRNITLVENDTDNEIVLRDNFNVLSDFIFDTTKSYNVTAFVAAYNGTPQLYPIAASDIEMITNLAAPETAWENDTVAILAGEDWNVTNTLNTLSDATPAYTSSNEAVATVDAEGNITVTGYGHAVITVETAETEAYLASKASFDLFVIEGKGTLAEPYSAADVQYFLDKVTDKVWVKGTILGVYTTSGNKLDTNPENFAASNIGIGTEEVNTPVQLSSNSKVRDNLNLVNNPTNLGLTVWVYGNIEKYFTVAGVKNVTDYSLDGENTLTGISSVKAEADKAGKIYSIDGRRLNQTVKGINIVDGKKVILK